MTNEEAKSELMQIYGLLSEERKIALDVAFKAMEQITKIADLLDGTIDHFDYDDAMDLLYEIKGVIGNG